MLGLKESQTRTGIELRRACCAQTELCSGKEVGKEAEQRQAEREEETSPSPCQHKAEAPATQPGVSPPCLVFSSPGTGTGSFRHSHPLHVLSFLRRDRTLMPSPPPSPLPSVHARATGVFPHVWNSPRGCLQPWLLKEAPNQEEVHERGA